MATNNKNTNSLRKAKTLDELLNTCPRNQIIGDNLVRAWSKINSPKYKKIVCSISGGSDSDVMLDIVWRCDKDNKIDYVWFDTGLEYQATKEHLKYLENKYNIKIKPYKAIKPIPLSCKQYGQPFINKQAAEYIDRLQRHSFKWEDKSFDELYKEYPKCKAALLWWCNLKKSNAFNIANNKWLKEFIIENPPTFKISSKCCQYAKKDVSHKLIKENTYELNIVGVRRAEGVSEPHHINLVLAKAMMDVIIIDLYFGIKILTKLIMKMLIMLNIQIAMLFMLYQEQVVQAVHLEEILRMNLKLFKNMNQNYIRL